MAQIATKLSDPTQSFQQVTLHSNKNPGDTVSLLDGIVDFQYFESIMSDTIRVNLIFADSGNSINDKNVLEGLPLVGQETLDTPPLALPVLYNTHNVRCIPILYQ